MKLFPKKYKPQDLRNRAKNYRESIKDQKIEENNTYSINILPTSYKISYQDFFLLYIRDFFNCKENIHNTENNIFQNLFLPSYDEILNISNCYHFFNKKWQSLTQIWVNKIENHISSTIKKNLNTNHKIIENYLSSPHKISLPDSELYIYILEKLHYLRETWKIIHKTSIWYQSFTLQSSIPLSHIVRKEEQQPQYILKYFVWAKCESLPVYVDDIDMCCGDVGLLVHPKDKRYNKYIGKNAIIPMCNRLIPIIGDENVNISVNNWIKRICPCADLESIELAKKFWLPTDIYVFDYKWYYTDSVHEPAYVWQERTKYYGNIQKLISDIWNVAEIIQRTTKVPYLRDINERLSPYKTDQIIIDLKEEKGTIINNIFNRSIHFSFIDKMFEWTFYEIKNCEQELNNLENWTTDTTYVDNLETTDNAENENENWEEIKEVNAIEALENRIASLKEKIINEIDKYLPDSITCDSQLPYWRKLPLLEQSDWTFSFFDIEKDCQIRKEKPLQFCFDFILLALVREWTLWIKKFWENKEYPFKLCEYEKIFTIFSKNERKIQNFVKYLIKINWDKPEYQKFIEIIQDLTDENNSSIWDCIKLIENSKFIKIEDNRLILNVQWISNRIINPDLIQFMVPCYLNDKNIHFNDTLIYNESQRNQIFQYIIIQQLILWKTTTHNLKEYTYDNENEFLWNDQLSKKQTEQSLRDFFSTNGENPIRLSFLIDGTFNKNNILLHSIHLKQIRNATRLCSQENFLPKDIKETLQNPPSKSNDYDLFILYKLQELHKEWIEIKTFEQYIDFIHTFKSSIQNIFFSRYLEIQKIKTTENVQFICTYFFNFLLTILYPLVPEFVDALCYVSSKEFMQPINPIALNKAIDYNTNVLYETFKKLKDIKLQFNIKQHEQCNIFIKSSPTICEILQEHEQVFKNHFHINNIDYLRLHEQNPLWYDVITSDIMTIWIQSNQSDNQNHNSVENIEKEIKYLEDKLDLLRQRIQILPEWEERKKVEEEYAKTKEEIENLTIKHSLLSSK